MDQDKLNSILIKLQPRQKQLADVLFSTTDTMTQVHQAMQYLLTILQDPNYAISIAPEDWAKIFEALVASQKVSGDFITDQARIAEKAPQTVQNVYAILTGQCTPSSQEKAIDVIENTSSFVIPAEIAPIQNALQQTLDRRFEVDRFSPLEGIIDEEEST